MDARAPEALDWDNQGPPIGLHAEEIEKPGNKAFESGRLNGFNVVAFG